MNNPGDQVSGKRQAGSVTLEDLLKIKRAETPGAKFWARFDEELRAKQLAAIVHRPTWWQSLPRPSFRALWVQLPVGAMAVMALSLVMVRNYQPASAESRDRGTGSAQVAIVPPAPAQAEPAPEIASQSGGSIASATEISQAVVEAPVAVDAAASVSSQLVAEISSQSAAEFERAFRSRKIIDEGLEGMKQFGFAATFAPKIPIAAKPAVMEVPQSVGTSGRASLGAIAMARWSEASLEVSGDNLKSTSSAKLPRPEMTRDDSYRLRFEGFTLTTRLPRQG